MAAVKPAREFTVDVSRWRRGGYRGPSSINVTSLLGPDGKMCCLGFWCKASGLSSDTIRGHGHPSDVDTALAGFIYPEDRLILINDDAGIDDVERMRLLRETFREHGIKVHFKGAKSLRNDDHDAAPVSPRADGDDA